MTTKKSRHEALRNHYLRTVTEFLESVNEEVLKTGSNEIAVPCVDSEGNDEYVVITFKVPTGSRDGDAYDGYEVAKDYERHIAEMAEKAKAQAASKAKKIERDRKIREEKAKLKAERENSKKVGS